MEEHLEDLQALLVRYQINFQQAKEAYEADRSDDRRATMFRCRGDVRRCEKRIEAMLRSPVP